MIKIGKMKKLVFLVLLLVAVTWSVNAQNRSINFEQTKEWKRIVKKAKKEKKLVFIDCYTSWCGPCKMLASKIFTQDAVADFFNENFVNTKYDMEKDTAPIVVAKGQDELAFRIIAVGEENGVAIVENRPLARALYAECKLDRQIPAQYYGAVAEILIYVFRANQKWSSNR